jgi:Arm DNA-binding domain
MPLSDRQINNLKPSGKPLKVSDGGGLHLLVTPSGGKLWRMAYRFNGKQKLLAFGAYPAIGLADARQKRDAAKKLLAFDVDPAFQAKQDKAARSFADASTFAIVADEFLAKNSREGKADATLTKKRWLISLALPDLGNRPIGEISASEILVPLKRVESLGNYETAKRLRAVIGQVFRYAISSAMAANDPTYGLKGALVSPKVIHRAAVTNWGGALPGCFARSGHMRERLKPARRSSLWRCFIQDRASCGKPNGLNLIWTILFGRYRKRAPKCAASTRSPYQPWPSKSFAICKGIPATGAWRFRPHKQPNAP